MVEAGFDHVERHLVIGYQAPEERHEFPVWAEIFHKCPFCGNLRDQRGKLLRVACCGLPVASCRLPVAMGMVNLILFCASNSNPKSPIPILQSLITNLHT